ncbi:MAG: dCMP deaminase family protein [Nanoarchaeota archaeon]|nr:dCMP deaminase family protein [Nanoarchaeota archaeon]MBU0962526.1 dCMP deaminase family protein [Nanoarchaeota archaeon]
MSERIRPSWDEYFMYLAAWAATRSSCRHLQTGAVIVKDKRVVATGYNGAPRTVENCLVQGCRKDQFGVDFEKKGTGNCRGTHAERNAMQQLSMYELEGSSMYTIYYPCSDCAKDIIGAQLSKIFYLFDYKGEGTLVDELIKEAPISLKQLVLDYGKCNEMIKFILDQQKRK